MNNLHLYKLSVPLFENTIDRSSAILQIDPQFQVDQHTIQAHLLMHSQDPILAHV